MITAIPARFVRASLWSRKDVIPNSKLIQFQSISTGISINDDHNTVLSSEQCILTITRFHPHVHICAPVHQVLELSPFVTGNVICDCIRFPFYLNALLIRLSTGPSYLQTFSKPSLRTPSNMLVSVEHRISRKLYKICLIRQKQ